MDANRTDADRTNSFIAKIKAASTNAGLDTVAAEVEALHFPGKQVLLSFVDMQRALIVAEGKRAVAEGLIAGTYFDRIDQVLLSGLVPEMPSNEEAVYESCCRSKRMTTTEINELEAVEENRKRKRSTTESRSRRSDKRSNNGDEEPLPQPQHEDADSQQQNKFSCRTGIDAKQTKDLYQLTYDAMKGNPRASAAIADGQSRVSIGSAIRYKIWKNAAVGAAHSGDIAHLVPAAVKLANSYWFVTDFLFGIDKKRTWKERTCLIHGTNTTATKAAKQPSSGIKHMVTNKVLLANQRDYFDSKPCVVIIPILCREAAINWTGGAYDAIMMIDSLGSGKELGDVSAAVVASLTNFTFSENIDRATPEDLIKATTLIREYTQAILYAQKKKKPPESEFTLGEAAIAFFPKVCNGESAENRNVRKISFLANDDVAGHPAPDPLLLVTKAVAVLQKRHSFDIVAAAEANDFDNFQSDLSLQAELEFLRHREEAFSGPDPIGMDIMIA